MNIVKRITAAVVAALLLVSHPLTAYAAGEHKFLDWSGAVKNEDGSITYKPFIEFTAGELGELFKQTLSFAATQVGCFFSGSAQELVMNWEAYLAWERDRYAEGYDGTEWDAAEYFTKEVVRNEDGTFTLSDRIMDDYVEYTKEVLDANSGYYLVKTIAKNNIDPSFCFTYKSDYDLFCSKFDESDIFYIYCNSGYWDYADMTGCDFVLYNNTYIRSYKEWVLYKADKLRYSNGEYKDTYSLDYIRITDGAEGIVTEKGSYIKVFKSVDAMKNYQAGYQPYYAGRDFLSYDSNNDNSVTVGGDYFTGNNWYEDNSSYYNDSSTTIINNYGSGITEDQLQDIVDALLDEIKKDKDASSGSTGNDNNSGGFGSGLAALMDGLGEFVNFLLELLGKVIGLVSTFLTSCMNLLEGLTAITGPFASLLSSLMSWVPQEYWDVIIAGMSAAIGIALWKMFKS